MRGAVVLLLFSVLAGCGGASQATAPATLPVLPGDVVPGLAATTEPVTAEDLEADFGAASSAGDVDISGFVSGRERVFQGESQRFDRVVSRTLEFEDADSASAYIELLREHAADLYGVGTTAREVRSDGRGGVLIDPASCACHRAEPTLSAAVSRGPRVSYLEVNGGGATPTALEDLLRQAP